MDGLSVNYIFWDATEHVVNLPKTEISELEPEFSEKPSRPSKGLIEIKQYKKMIAAKEKIPNINNWSKWSKMVNPYEKIPRISSKNHGRDYYKMYELIKFFNLTNYETSLSLCEAPGNFIGALTYFNPKVDWYGHSFYTHGSPEFDEAFQIKDQHGYDRIVSKGDLTEVDTIQYIVDSVPKIDIVTADGAFDTSFDPNNKEPLTLQLIFSEIITALRVQKEGGVFILKLFDTFTRPTAQAISIITSCYKNTTIVKPRTSRPTNSEKYLVARGFKGASEELIDQLTDILKKWDPNNYCRTFGKNLEVEQLENKLKNYNKQLIEEQFSSISDAITCSREEGTPEKQIDGFQNRKAVEFCGVFGINTSLSSGGITGCKHSKKTKIQLKKLKNTMVCEKCFMLFVT